MNPFKYFWAWFETNHFTLYFAIFLFVLSLLKYLPWPKVGAKKILFGIILLGLVLRVAWLFFSGYEPKTQWSPTHLLESDIANIQAIDMTRGVWFADDTGQPSARRPIGYPLALGLVYKLFGYSAAMGLGLNLALFVWGVGLLYLCAKTVFDEWAGLLAAFFYSIYPVSIYSIKLMTDEHLFIPLWLFGLYLLLREIAGRSWRWPLIWYGVVFGLATMTRTHSIFMPAVVAVAYALLKYPWKKVLLAFFAVAILMQAVNLPWMIRNYKIYGAVVPYTLNNSYVYRSFNPTATPEGGGHVPDKGEKGYSEELANALASGNPVLYHQLSGREITRWILSDPFHFALFGTCRAIYFMGWDRGGGMWPIWFQFQEGSYDPARVFSKSWTDFFEELGYAYYYGIFFTFLFSIVLMVRRWKGFSLSRRASILMIGSCFLFWLGEHMIIYPDRKYRFPLEPLMILYGAFFIQWWMNEFQWRFPRVKRG